MPGKKDSALSSQPGLHEQGSIHAADGMQAVGDVRAWLRWPGSANNEKGPGSAYTV